MLSGANRWLVCLFVFLCMPVASAKNLNILIIGQSISSNCNEKKYSPVSGVYQVDLQGNRVAAKDPFLWADCNSGSIWIPFGRLIIESGLTDEVTLMPIGVAGTKLVEWLPGGIANEKMQRALAIAHDASIRFDYIFFYQGSSDIGENPNKYKNQLVQLNRIVRKGTGYVDWLIAQHSRCFDKYDAAIAQVQRSFIGEPFYAGPNSNQLGNEYRLDRCHLNQEGQEKMASLWVDALINAAKKKVNIEKETLRYYLK
jgi:hypothetical protein